eukprot:460525-Hanusia_phi.AAC.1
MRAEPRQGTRGSSTRRPPSMRRQVALLVRGGDLPAVSCRPHPVASETEAVFDRRAAGARRALSGTGRAVACPSVAACQHLVILVQRGGLAGMTDLPGTCSRAARSWRRAT